jgi:hypothetical protein
MADIDTLLQGSIDMHLHHGPDIIPRRLDALETARQAQLAGMRAIVLKHHYYPTEPLAIMVNQLVSDVKVLGSICLDYEVGGLNFHALEKSAKLGAKVVWMPTMSSANSRARMRALGLDLEGEGFSILNGKGQLVPQMGRILALVREYELVLASGHLSPAEIFTLVDEACKVGIQRLVITHASDTGITDQALTLEDQQRLVQMGAFVEHTCVSLLPTESSRDPKERVNQIKAVGAEHCIMSTDLGQAKNPLPVEGMRMFIATMLHHGITPEEIELMVKVNPARLLDLD